ncbi:MAG: hypothetical protein EOO06_07575 [Chitinophagaceae bacterium]|nr:MAG: hypothetical protein EOO06_07575 [Chitinophagaceae bacterium]
MNNIYQRLQSAKTTSLPNGAKAILTPKQFLGIEGSNSYFSVEEFLIYAQSLREVEVEQLDQCIDCMRSGLRMVGAIITRMDKGNRPYSQVKFIKLNANVELKVILEGGMKQFIIDYQDGKFLPGFSLEELVEEATNA